MLTGMGRKGRKKRRENRKTIKDKGMERKEKKTIRKSEEMGRETK